jgi:hypothetical protein
MNALTAGIYTKLTGGTALTSLLTGGTATPSIYYEQAPHKSVLPYVVFNIQGGGDLNLCPGRMKEVLYFVRGYTKASTAAAGLIDAQIDALLHNQSVTVTGWSSIDIQRETDMEETETAANGEIIYMAGGVYRFSLDS